MGAFSVLYCLSLPAHPSIHYHPITKQLTKGHYHCCHHQRQLASCIWPSINGIPTVLTSSRTLTRSSLDDYFYGDTEPDMANVHGIRVVYYPCLCPIHANYYHTTTGIVTHIMLNTMTIHYCFSHTIHDSNVVVYE
jgi:hypothetical protein